ncbi:MAG: InlB B-repeat-containing protein [Oscillospiraceae bacterium]|nr:InlB B-repeat-containing protein [Oscillospiraceae bacterium]
MKRLLAVILASLLILSSATAAASAYKYDSYKDGKLTKYDFTDSAVLTTEQYASMLLDYADEALAKANITMDLSVLGKLDATSIDNALSSVYKLINGNSGILWMAGGLGDVKVSAIKDARRKDGTDVAVINSLLQFLVDNNSVIKKVVIGGIGKQRRDGGLSLGVANSFVKVDLNIEVMLRELLWGLAYPNTAYNSSTTVDTMLQTIIQNALAGVPIIPESVRNLVDLNSTKKTYDFIEDLLQAAYNDMAVPMLNEQVIPWLEMQIRCDETGTLADLFNTGYQVPTYTVPAGKTLIGELNNIAGQIVNGLLKGYTGWVDGDNSKLTDNVVSVARFVLKKTGGYFFPDWQKHIATPEKIDAMSKEELIAYIARSVINASVGYMYIPEDVTTVVGVTWEAVKQLMAQFLPERDYSGYPKTVQGILDMLADYVAYNVNPGIDLNARDLKKALNYGDGMDKMLTTAVQWLAAEPQNYTGLLPDTTVDTSNGWKALDDIIFKLLDKSLLPAKFADSGSETILKDVVYSVLNGLIMNQDLTCLTDLFERNQNGAFAKQTVKKSIVRLVTDILNAIIPGTITTKYYDSLDVIVKNKELANIVERLINSLNGNKGTLVPPIVNIVAQVLGLADKSKFGQMKFTGPTRAKDAYTVTIYNGSKGINRGYTDKNGNFTQDALYKYRIASVSATAYNMAGNGTNVGVSGVKAGDIINGGFSKDIAVSKPGATDTTVVLTIGYFILTESGESLTGTTPLYASYYTYFCSDTVDDNNPKDAEASGMSKNRHSIVKPRAGFIGSSDSERAIGDVCVEVKREKETGALHDRDATVRQNASTFNNGSDAYFKDVMFSIVTKDENFASRESLWEAKAGVTRADIPDGKYVIKFSVFAEHTYWNGSDNTTWEWDTPVFVYNDYDLPAKYSQYSGEQRQRANYSADADAEWAEYQAALIQAANYTLRPKLLGNFNDASYIAAYQTISTRLTAAAEALDAKLTSASVDSLKTAVEAVQGAPNPEGSVYWDQGYNFFGYDDFNSVSWNGWKEARNRAMNLYNSTKAPEGPVAPKHPGEGANECQLATYNKKYAQWEKDHAAWETKMATWKAPTISAVDVAYAEQQIALWGPRLIKLDAVKTYLDAAIAMCTIDSADASKYDADRWEAYAKSFAYAQKVSTSFNASTTMRTQVREAMNNLIYNWKRLIPNPVVTVTFTFTVNGVTHAVLTGNQGDPVDLSSIEAPAAPVGMHFVGWGNVPATFDADATFKAQFANNTDTKYTVNVYNMDTTGNYPATPDSTYQGAGETNSTADITADAVAAEGFSLDSAKSTLTGTIAADGSLVLSIYYSRKQYTITYANTDLEPDTYYYGATVSARTPEKEGFAFQGWEEEVPSTMPAQNITLTAKWNENPADYTNYDIAVAAANAKKTEANYEKTYTEASRNALDAALAVDVSNKKLSEQGVVDAQTAAINAAVKGLEKMTYNATFYVDGEEYRVVPTKVGEQIVAPEAPSKQGYTFTGWTPEVGTMGIEDISFNAVFSAGTVAYTVETYVMDVSGNYGDAAIENKSATTGETVSVTPEAREGFTVAAESVLSGKVEADGSLVLKVYYSRNQYKLTVDGNVTNVYYGAAISVAEPAAREGYTFAGWDRDVPETMPASDVTLVSQWNENDADYTAYNAAKAAAEAKQTEANFDKTYTAESRQALADALAKDVSGRKYTQQGEVDAAAKAINDAVTALELMTYKATFYVDGDEYQVVEAKVGEAIAKPDDPSKTGYVFTGWDPEVGTMGTEDLTFNAKFSAGEVSYTVETYVMGLDGQYGAAETKNVPATTGAEITLTPDAREGFTVAGESVLTGKVAADSSLVLKVYYSRNQYKLTVDGTTTEVYYGAALEIADPEARTGYTFAGWKPAAPATMPANDVTLESQWTENDADYTAYDAAVKAAQAKQAESDYAARYTEASRNALAAALAVDVSDKKYTQQGEVDAATTAINNAVAGLNKMTYNAIFTVDGEEYAKVPTKVDDQIVAPKDPSKEGYNFAGWRPSVGVMGTADATFEAVFTAAGNTAYTVNTYVMGTDGTYGEPTSDTLTGTTGSTATFVPETREGFTVDNEQSVLSGEIAADGSLVLKVFYSRNQYTLTAEGVAYTFYYGAAVSVADPVKAHYTFAGWDPTLPETMPAHDATVAAKWTEDDADYTAYNAAVAAAQEKQGEENYGKKYTAETRAALAEALANDVSGKKYSEQGLVDAATTAINDAVKALELMTYTATFYVDGAVHATVQAKVGAQIVAPEAPSKTGYVFTGWDPAVGVMGTEDVSFNAQFSAGEVSYKVETYVMGLDGQYGAAETKTVPATTGAAVSVEPEAREGFTVADNSVLSGVVAADSSLVLKVYYSRNQYKLSVDGVESDVYYGAALNIAAPAARVGFTFTGWNIEVPANMPASDLTLVSQWSENDADYTAYNAAVAAAQAKQGEENYDKMYTAETRDALAGALAIKVAGKKYSEQSVVDAAAKAINDAVAALEVMTYNAIFTVDGAQYEVVPTKVGEQIVAPKDPAKEGYVFKGWDKEVGKMGVEDITFTAQFEKASGIAYTVEVYTMDVNGNYGAAETKTLYGTTDAEVTADTTAAEGFTFDESAANVVSGKVAADGSLVLKVYFARNQYKLTVDGAESEVYYGAALDIATPAARKGYTFTGWNVDVPANMPASDLTLVSQWSENDADYTAYNAAVAAAQAKKTETDYDKTYTAESRAALDAALAEKVSGKKYSEQNVVDAATKAINDAVAALELMTYNATFYVDGAEYRVVPTKVGEQIIAPEAPSKTGYVFTGWDKEVGVMGTENVSFNAQFSAGEVSYKVETYVMGLDGQYGAAETKTVPATTGAEITLTPDAREGFTVADNSVLSGTVAADGSLVLKVYYSRNQYKLSVDGVESMVYYGAAISVAEPTKEHETFNGWDPALPETMPAHDVTVVSTWIKDDADYTAYNAAKTAAEDKQKEENYDKKYTAETRNALAEALKTVVPEGLKYDEQETIDAATTAINDAVKALEFETYTATFYVNGEVHATVTAKVGEQIAAPADPIVDGYNFTGWDPEVGTMGIENVRFDAILVASGSSIISVTPTTPNYGGMHQYAVKVKGEPQKLRIVDAYGTTRTFDRNTSMTSDVNAFGILKIEKTEDSEIWTLNVNLVEGEYTALAKFDKAWEEDGYDFTVKFDTKPSEPVSDGVLDVTYNTPNYGGKQEYFVKVSGKADKIQIAYENGGTTTRARYDLRVSIKSYDAQGNEVDAKSANLAYEIWTVKLNIAEGKHVARAKYGKVWTGDHEFTVVYDVKPAPKGVVDVTYDTPNYGGKQQYSFKVDGKASKIQIAYGEGGTTTFIRIDPRVSIKSYDAQGNEVSANSADLAYEIWAVKLSIPEGKHLAKAKYGKTWTDGFEFDVVITSKPIKAVSVTAVSVSADSVAVTVNGTAKKVRITYASGATRTYDRDDIGVSIASDGDGEIWTINVKLTEGDYTATAKYMANGKQVWDTTDFAFTV